MEIPIGLRSDARKASIRAASEGASFVGISFALRGAPCGDDPDLTGGRLGRHHREQATAPAEPDTNEAIITAMLAIQSDDETLVEQRRGCLSERDPAPGVVGSLLLIVPLDVVGSHKGDASDCAFTGTHARIAWGSRRAPRGPPDPPGVGELGPSDRVVPS